jgi:hypothetical protein
MKLTAQNVRATMEACLFQDGEPQDNPIIVEGIMNKFGFSPVGVAAHKDDIASMLAELPDEFQASKGGGMSFLNACMTRSGDHWAEHPTMGELFCLGMAAGLVKCCVPRDMWHLLPGCMPYYVVLDNPVPQPA